MILRQFLPVITVLTAISFTPVSVALYARTTSGITTGESEAVMGFEEKVGTVGEESFRFRLLAPPEANPTKSYHLVVFLHGAGERGTDNRAQLTHFGDRMATEAYRERYPSYVLAVQCARDHKWVEVPWGEIESTPFNEEPAIHMRRATAAIQQTVKSEPIDRERIYLTGLSMGGYGTFDLATRHADWFAGALAVCGGGDTASAHRMIDLPLSVWHGDADRAVPVERSRRMISALQALGDSPDYRELPGIGHGSWNQAYGEDGALDWLFAQRRPPGFERTPGLNLLKRGHARFAEGETIVFFGDSITQAGVGPKGYVTLIEQAIAGRPEGSNGASIVGAGISGHKVPDLEARFDRDVAAKGPTIVVIYIGINDVWHGAMFGEDRGTPIDEFDAGLRRLVAKIQALGALPILATPSVIGESYAGDNELDAKLDTFSDVTRGIAKELGLPLCDLRKAFQDHLAIFNRENVDKGVLTSDTVHLSEAGNRLVADAVARVLYEVRRDDRDR